MSFPNPRNTLQQDFFLLAKQRYKLPRGMDLTEAARRLVSRHVCIELEYVGTSTVIFWLLREFVDTGILFNLQYTHRSLGRFLTELGEPIHWLVPPDDLPRSADMLPAGQRATNVLDTFRDKQGSFEYRYTLIHMLLSEVRLLQVRKDDVWLMPFEECEPDPTIQSFLTTEEAIT